ncbi:MAG: diguanylate cyclase [Pseudomonadota bacterium]
MTKTGGGRQRRVPVKEQAPPAELYHSDRTRVYRTMSPDGTASVICKEPLGPDALERLRHESDILARLHGVAGVPQLADVPHPAGVIALEDCKGVPLADILRGERLDVAALLELALGLSQILAAMHWRGVVHRDINPGNILLAGARRAPQLIDFNLATSFAEEAPGQAHEREIAGTLAYLAPEQSGRTGRAIDQRADLYALGATLYEVAVGHPPFEHQDPLQLIHEHLTRTPVAPLALAPHLPPLLSDIILRLLEKEPDRRYQGAEGLAHDLAKLAGALAAGTPAVFAPGQRDFPLRLCAPARLVGRAGEIAALQAAFERAQHEAVRGAVVCGAPGVGKTSLIDQLRPYAGARRGRFVSGKFDRHRQDRQAGAVYLALRNLGRLLLAEPEAELALLRTQLLDRLGANAGLVAEMVPEFSVLLDTAPQALSGTLLEAAPRIYQATLDMLRAVVSPERPLVMVIDDLQWAPPLSLGFLDYLLQDPDLRGLLVVLAYRAPDVTALHPLAAVLPRWERLGSAMLRLENLAPRDAGDMLGEMLRLAPQPAGALAEALGTHTGGNPYDTVELVNALRRDRVLTPSADGWTWDAGTLHRYVGRSSVIDLLRARIRRLPAPSQALLGVMACLGGQVRLALLQTASGLAAQALDEQLAAALEDGLLVFEQDDSGTLRFRHDRVQHSAYEMLAPAERTRLHLALARRLRDSTEFVAMAAAQYLPALALLDDDAERRDVAGLLRRAAAQVRLLNYVACEGFLAAALQLMAAAPDAAGAALLTALRTERMGALYNLGRCDEADALYQAIASGCSDPLELVDATYLQAVSLMGRSRPGETLKLTLGMLARLGLPPPSRLPPAMLEQQMEALCRWIEQVAGADPAQYPEPADAHVRAIARLLERITPAAFFLDQGVMAWCTLETHRLAAEHGLRAPMIIPLSSAGLIALRVQGRYRQGYDMGRNVLRIGEARGYTEETARVRSQFAMLLGHWVEPLEDNAGHALRAREVLLQMGNVQMACISHIPTLTTTFECAPTLAATVLECHAAQAFAGRTGITLSTPHFTLLQEIALELQGKRQAGGNAGDAIPRHADQHANPLANCDRNAMQALGGALFGDVDRLVRHADAAMTLVWAIQGTYNTALVFLLQALSMAQRAQAATGAERAALLAEFDQCRHWIAQRAADAPANFLHWLKWLDAERAWLADDFRLGVLAFDAALAEMERHQRPWHQALIAERAALFNLAHGMERAGRTLMAEARRRYHAWGAAAKVAQMDNQYTFLRAGTPVQRELERRGSVNADSIDMLAVLRASQALSSETSLPRLKARVAELLGAMTGATQVQMVLPRDEAPGWVLADTGGDAWLTLEDAAAAGLLPVSAFRYVERTRTPLLVEDATRDDRFARDAYLSGLSHCSLLLLPVLSQGVLRAVLLLENRLSRGAFSADRLDAVKLVAGQLAVSLDNARLYASLERKVAERTGALELANRELAALSITDPLTGLANRRHFDRTLEAEWLRALRPRAPLGAAMIDIDQFKLYNDHYGHQRGDACLKMVAATLAQSVRHGVDLAARYGGEEFAFILPGADLHETRIVAERARAAVAALGLPHAVATHGIVTVSIGIATLVPTPERDPATLFGDADAALYRAKQDGRNQVADDQDKPACV